MRGLSITVGVVVGVMAGISLNLLTTMIQTRFFAGPYSNQAIILTLVVTVLFGLLGYWLSEKIELPTLAPEIENATKSTKPASRSRQTTEMTRLTALLSYTKIRGRGVRLHDILSIGSVIDVDTDGK